MSALDIGFMPLLDAAPLVAAEAKGFFATEGLSVALRREAAWATLRDKLAVGALDAAHFLAPLALTTSLGLGGPQAQLVAPLVLNRGGAAMTLAARLAGDGADPAASLRRVIALRKAQESSPLTFAIVFPYAIHNYLLRRWLADAGLDPLGDVRVVVAPPRRMPELLAEGAIEGFAAGEPWNLSAEAAGAGRIVARASQVWPDAPDKVLALTRARADADPGRLATLLRALTRAAAWCAAPENRGELAALLARPEYVGAPADLIEAGLADVRFEPDDPAAPFEDAAVWLVGQMSRWGQLDDAAAAAQAARATFRPDILARALGASA